MRKPYFCHAVGDFVMDEMCQCGHLKSSHGSSLVKLRRSSGHSVRLPDEGSCCAKRCSCKKFVWVRFVYTDEYAGLIKSDRPAAQAV